MQLIRAGVGDVASAQRLADRWGVQVTFPGWVNAEDRRELLRHAAVLAVPSVLPEPFGIGGIEAASEGLPAVAFDSGGIFRLAGKRCVWDLCAGRGVLLDRQASLKPLSTFSRTRVAIKAFVARSFSDGLLHASPSKIGLAILIDALSDAVARQDSPMGRR